MKKKNVNWGGKIGWPKMDAGKKWALKRAGRRYQTFLTSLNGSNLLKTKEWGMTLATKRFSQKLSQFDAAGGGGATLVQGGEGGGI